MALKLGRTAALHFLSQVAVSVSGFVATFAIARILGADGVGVYALGMSIIVWLNVPLSGFREALKKRISEGVDKNAYYTSGILLNVVSVSVPAVLVLLFSQQINRYVGAPVAVLIVVLLLINSIFKTILEALHGEKKVAQAGWVQFIERTLRTLFQVALLLLGYKIAGLFVGYAVALTASSLFALYFISLRPIRPRRIHFERLVKYAKSGWSGGLKGNAFNYMDIIVLGFFVSPTLVGIYKVAWTLGSFLVVLSNSISSTLFPEISDISSSGETEQVKHYIDEGLVFTGLFLIPGLFGATVLGSELLRIYNTEFTRGTIILVILIGALILDAYASQILSVIKALDRPDIVLRIDLALVGMNIALNLLLVYLYGWYGAAVATLLSGGVTLGLSYLAITRLIGRLTIPAREIGKEVIASLVMLVCILGLRGFAPSGITGTLLLVGAGAVIYIVTLLSLSPRIRQKAQALTLPAVRQFARR